jgi:hypothetical protein
MREFQPREVNDFAATIIDEISLATVIHWIADNVEPDDIYTKERLLDYARDYGLVDAPGPNNESHCIADAGTNQNRYGGNSQGLGRQNTP